MYNSDSPSRRCAGCGCKVMDPQATPQQPAGGRGCVDVGVTDEQGADRLVALASRSAGSSWGGGLQSGVYQQRARAL